MPTALDPPLSLVCLLGIGLIMRLMMDGGSQNPRRDTHPYGSTSSVELNRRCEAIARLRAGQQEVIWHGAVHPQHLLWIVSAVSRGEGTVLHNGDGTPRAHAGRNPPQRSRQHHRRLRDRPGPRLSECRGTPLHPRTGTHRSRSRCTTSHQARPRDGPKPPPRPTRPCGNPREPADCGRPQPGHGTSYRRPPRHLGTPRTADRSTA
jgi:hypothetical protein